MVFGKNSFIGPGYDWYFVKLKGIIFRDSVVVGRNAWIEIVGNGKIEVGDGTNIGRNVTISSKEKITI